MWKASFVVLGALVVAAAAASRMVGAPVDVDPSDARVQNALNFAVGEHNKGTNDVFLRGVARVLHVQRQVVAGMKYVITVSMGKTSCRKNAAAEVCTVIEDQQRAQPYQCTFTVVDKAWLSELTLLSQECNKHGGREPGSEQ